MGNVSGRLLDSSRIAPEAPAAPAEVKESEEAPKAQPVGELEEEGVVKEAGEDEIVVAASPIDMMDMGQPDDRDDSKGATKSNAADNKAFRKKSREDRWQEREDEREARSN